jgi:pyruvate dehydrogenase E1 component beta subunit
MREDARVILIGEDQAGGAGCDPSLRDAWGGPFGVTKGLISEFGVEPVIDTPISEMAFIGAAVGAAMTGLRPWRSDASVFGSLYGSDFEPSCQGKVYIGRPDLGSGHHRTRCRVGWPLNTPTRFPLCLPTFWLKVIEFPRLPMMPGLLMSSIRDDDPVVYVETRRSITQGSGSGRKLRRPHQEGDRQRERSDSGTVADGSVLWAASRTRTTGWYRVIDPRSIATGQNALLSQSEDRTIDHRG